jgi:hypothetical protein
MGGGGAGDALGRVRCHKCWRAARTAAGQRGQCKTGGNGRAGAHEQPRKQGRGGRRRVWERESSEAETRSEATGGGGRGAGERLRWCEERLLEARGGGPKVWKRKGDSAGWPCGRGPLYPTGRPTVLACCVPKPKPFSPLSLPGRGGRPCKCAFSDTERTAFSTAVVSVSAVGGHDAAHAHAHAHARRHAAPAAGRPPRRLAPLHTRRLSHRAAQHGAGTACGDTAEHHAASPWCACQRAQSPFQRSLRAGRGRADDLLATSQAGVVDCMALQRAAGLIRHGRCRARACDLREPLIIHARRRPPLPARLGARLFVVACATGLHAHGACLRAASGLLRSVACGRPALAAARSVVGPSSGS